jgi:Uma2 family endonuclease
MATATETPTEVPSPPGRRTLGPADHGREIALEEFIEADWEGGWLYELARGIIIVTEVPGTSHGRAVRRVARLFIHYEDAHPGFIRYAAGGGECRIRLPGMKCDRHPDQAIYLNPEPKGTRIWARWVPQIVVEVVSPSGEDRDYVEKREEYLRAGVSEYWILDQKRRRMLVLLRVGDVWDEVALGEDGVHRTELLPGLEARVGELLGPPAEDPED